MLFIPILILILLVIIFIYHISDKRSKRFRGGYSVKQTKESISNIKKESIDAFFNKENREKITKIINDKNPKLAVRFEDIIGDTKYADKTDDQEFVNTSTHLGQLKLFLSELQFLTNSLEKHDDYAFVIYSGSAPSNKAPLLSDLFPNVRFLFVDPNEHLFHAYRPLDKPGHPNVPNQYTDQNIGKKICYLKTQSGNRFGINQGNVDFFYNGEITSVPRRDAVAMSQTTDLSNIAADITDIFEDETKRFVILEDFFTDEIAENLAKSPIIRENKFGKILFISDIRTAQADTVGDFDILWNSAQQYTWLRIMADETENGRFMFKFRLPFGDSDKSAVESSMKTYSALLDRARNYNYDIMADYTANTFRYLQGDIFIQAFPGKISTESRLCGDFADAKKELKVWFTNGENRSFYEDKFTHHNRFIREYAFYDTKQDPKIHLDGCADCALFFHICNEYDKKYGKSADIVHKVLELLHKTLKSEFHGERKKPYKDIKEVLDKQYELIGKK